MQAIALSIFPVLHVLGHVILVFAGTMLVPLAFAFFAGEAALRLSYAFNIHRVV